MAGAGKLSERGRDRKWEDGGKKGEQRDEEASRTS